MKKIFTLLLLFCFLISCERKEPNFSEEMIENLADRGEMQDGKNGVVRLPSAFSFIDLYVLTNDKEIHLTNINELSFFYDRYYSKEFKTFKEFLNSALNKQYCLDKKRFPNPHYLESFRINSDIKKEYILLGFDKFLKKHSKPSTGNHDFELDYSSIRRDEYLTIKYLLYLNKYDISSDCNIGKDYIRKREDSFK